MAGDVAQVRGQGAFHQLEAVVQVVFQRPGRRFVKGDRRGDRLLVTVHAGLVVDDALAVLLFGDGLGFQRRTGTEQQG
ncbi:hypothetical protein D3C78_1867180 [compost metagenome]